MIARPVDKAQPPKRWRLSRRVVGFSSLVLIIAMIFIGTLITRLYADAALRSFDALLALQKFNLVGSVSLTTRGQLFGSPQIGDDRYNRPGSGWAWQVTPVEGAIDGILLSGSTGARLDLPGRDDVPLDPQFRRVFTMTGEDGRRFRVHEEEIVLGEAGQVASFVVRADLSEIESDQQRFAFRVWAALGGLAALVILLNAGVILAAFKPLDRARNALGDVRVGSRDRLDEDYPAEIAPLVEEINALIENNRTAVERARTQVGDLAHSLKTPLSVIKNEAAQLKGPSAKLVSDQSDAIRTQIDRYLQKARIAAQAGGTAFRTDAGASTQKLLRVFGKLAPNITFRLNVPETPILFAGEEQDFEELLGNILENASKWSSGNVAVYLENDGSDSDFFILLVDDDGPGIADDQRDLALKRGQRLDETKPGTGLGLSIVRELVSAYGGSLAMDDAPLGGLRVRISLPKLKP